MKKKIILSLLIVLALFVITGCGKSDSKGSSSDNLHKLEFVDMRYNEPKNYSKKEPIDIDNNNKVLIYRFNNDDKKTINLYYYKDKNLVPDEDPYDELTIDEVKCRVFHNDDLGVVYDTYECAYNNDLYRIELNGVDKYKDEFDEFMKDVSFE